MQIGPLSLWLDDLALEKIPTQRRLNGGLRLFGAEYVHTACVARAGHGTVVPELVQVGD